MTTISELTTSRIRQQHQQQHHDTVQHLFQPQTPSPRACNASSSSSRVSTKETLSISFSQRLQSTAPSTAASTSLRRLQRHVGHHTSFSTHPRRASNASPTPTKLHGLRRAAAARSASTSTPRDLPHLHQRVYNLNHDLFLIHESTTSSTTSCISIDTAVQQHQQPAAQTNVIEARISKSKFDLFISSC